MNIKGYQLRKPEVWQWLSGSLPIHLLELQDIREGVDESMYSMTLHVSKVG
jgi:hypothetical protein